MPKKKKPQNGHSNAKKSKRPVDKTPKFILPPKIDASPEEVARALFEPPPKR